MDPDMVPTPESSTVDEIGYDDASEEIWVRFRHGGIYIYSNVPPVVWDDFARAASKGSFINQVIKPSYPCRRI